MPHYPETPGFKEAGGTSQLAAESMEPRAATLRAKALRQLVEHPDGLTADEIAAALRETPFAMRPRISELHAIGLVQKSTLRRPNASGKQALVWFANPDAL